MDTWKYSPFSQVQQVSVQAEAVEAGAKSLFIQARNKLKLRTFKELLNFPSAFRGEQVRISLQVNGNLTVAPVVLQELIFWSCISEDVL